MPWCLGGIFNMNHLSLNIANYLIEIESEDLDLVPGKRFGKFNPPTHPAPLKGGSFTTIKLHSGSAEPALGSKCLFSAPYVEEIDGMRLQKNSEFWSVWKNNDDLFIKTIFPLSDSNKKGLLKFSLKSNEWRLWIDQHEEKSIDPMEYPLDGLILYYLTVINDDIMIHASGVNYNGKGYIFSGVSGKGKTTMTRLWQNEGARIIHDDRLILRKTGKGYKMYNTPVYDNEEPSESGLDAVFIIDHGKENRYERLHGAGAISAVMANCIQHNWGPEIISGLLSSATDLCSKVPVYKLSFKPDNSIIDHILNGQTATQP